MTIFDLLTILKVGNPATLYKFLKTNPEIYNKKTKTLNVLPLEFKKKYKEFKKDNRKNALIKRLNNPLYKAKVGRPKVIK